MDPTSPNMAYQKLVDLILQRLGLQLNEHRLASLTKVVDGLASSSVSLSVNQLYQQLETADISTVVWQQIVQALTVGETYFYRNSAHVNALSLHVLPALIKARRLAGDKRLRLWSAGCATGEEPYTLAMILYDVLPDLKDWSITILATDINERYLQQARIGHYRPHSFRGETPPWVQSRWFRKSGDGFVIDASLRSMVTFMPLNLVQDSYPLRDNNTTDLDLVLCRNVTIYFDRTQTKAVAERFFQTLIPGGWLIVGHSEPQAGVYDCFVTHHIQNAILYQKPVRAAPVAMPRSKEQDIVRLPVKPPVLEEKDHFSIWTDAYHAANNEEWDTAIRLLKMIEDDVTYQKQVQYLRGLIFMHQGLVEEAAVALRLSIHYDPDFVLAHYTLGELHDKAGEQLMACQHWQTAQRILVGLDPEQTLPFADDLTVEMLNGLLSYQLRKYC